MTKFIVDCSIGTDRISVRWKEDMARLHFVADLEAHLRLADAAGENGPDKKKKDNAGQPG